MKFFYIDDTYITMLLQHDASVQQNHGKRPYIGVVLNINGIEYFAPLASPKPKYYSGSIIYFKIFSHGTKAKLLGVIKLNCMIPVPKQYLKSVLIDTNTPYGLLLASQHRYIKSKQDAIKKEAHTLHHLVVEKKRNAPCKDVLQLRTSRRKNDGAYAST